MHVRVSVRGAGGNMRQAMRVSELFIPNSAASRPAHCVRGPAGRSVSDLRFMASGASVPWIERAQASRFSSVVSSSSSLWASVCIFCSSSWRPLRRRLRTVFSGSSMISEMTEPGSSSQ